MAEIGNTARQQVGVHGENGGHLTAPGTVSRPRARPLDLARARPLIFRYSETLEL